MDPGGDRLLRFHCGIAPCAANLRGDLSGHGAGCRPLFAGICEHADAFEAGAFQEVDQNLEVRIGLAREPDDERGPDGEIRHDRTRPPDQVLEVGAPRRPPHAAKHGIGGVLHGHVQVGADLRLSGHRLQQPGRHVGGMAVEDPDPEIAFDRRKPPHERGQTVPLAGIPAVPGGILADEIDFLDTLRDESAHLLLDGGGIPASMPAPDARDDAECAGMIASFRDLDVGQVRRRQPQPRLVRLDQRVGVAPDMHRRVRGARKQPVDDIRDMQARIDSKIRVGAGKTARERPAFALRQTAGDDDPRPSPVASPEDRPSNRVLGFAARRFDKAAGVDDEDVGL